MCLPGHAHPLAEPRRCLVAPVDAGDDAVHAVVRERGMTDQVRAEELRRAERRLQAAQLASDVAALDALLDDRLVFSGPDGAQTPKRTTRACVAVVSMC